MRCRYCGKNLSIRGTAGLSEESRTCDRCARLKRLRFVTRQGDGVTGFREIMIWQHANEPNRKLIETRSWHFTVFINESEEICGFELADADQSHLLKWWRGERPVFYRVENIGKGYHNRDELRLNGDFQADGVIAELVHAGGNIRPHVRKVLLDGISAYEKKG